MSRSRLPVGARVQIKAPHAADWNERYATVVTSPAFGDYRIMVDNKHEVACSPDYLVEVIPRFTSVDEAERWMEGRANP